MTSANMNNKRTTSLEKGVRINYGALRRFRKENDILTGKRAKEMRHLQGCNSVVNHNNTMTDSHAYAHGFIARLTTQQFGRNV